MNELLGLIVNVMFTESKIKEMRLWIQIIEMPADTSEETVYSKSSTNEKMQKIPLNVGATFTMYRSNQWITNSQQ